MSELMGIKEAARFLGCHRNWVTNLMNRGVLKWTVVGKEPSGRERRAVWTESVEKLKRSGLLQPQPGKNSRASARKRAAAEARRKMREGM